MSKPKSKLLNRVLAAVLAVVMVFSLMPYPTTVYAADENNQAVVQNTDDTQTGGDNTQIGGDDTQTDVVEQRKAIGFPADQTVFYTGEEQTVTLTVTELVAGDKLTYVVGEETNEVTIDADGIFTIPVSVNDADCSVNIKVTYEGGVEEKTVNIFVKKIELPTDVELSYTGADQAVSLVVNHLVKDDVVSYQIDENEVQTKTMETNGSYTIPVTVNDVGTNHVSISVKRTETYGVNKTVNVKVSPADIPGVSVVFEDGLTYDGTAKALATVSGLQADDKVYWNGSDTYVEPTKAEGSESYVAVYEATNAGQYSVQVKVKRNENYKEFVNGPQTVEIKQAPLSEEFTVTAKSNLTYSRYAQTLVTVEGAVPANGQLVYYVAEGTVIDLPTDAVFEEGCAKTDAGTYTVFYKAVPNDVNFAETAVKSVNVSIAKAKAEIKINDILVDGEPIDLENPPVIKLYGSSDTVEVIVSAVANCEAQKFCPRVKYELSAGADCVKTLDVSGGIYEARNPGEVVFSVSLSDFVSDNYEADTVTYAMTIQQQGSEEDPLISFAEDEITWTLNKDKVVSKLEASRGNYDGEQVSYEGDAGDIVYSLDNDKKGLKIDTETGVVTVNSYTALVAYLENGEEKHQWIVTAKKAGNDYFAEDSDSYVLNVEFAPAVEATVSESNDKGWYTVPAIISVNGYTISPIVDAQAFDETFKNELTVTENDDIDSAKENTNIKYYLMDGNGNITAPQMKDLQIDTVAPAEINVDITKGILGNLFFNKTFKATITATDAISGLEKLEWKLVSSDGKEFKDTVTFENGAAVIDYEVPNDEIGDLELAVTVYDNAGNSSELTGEKGIVFDTINPKLTVSHHSEAEGNSTPDKHYYQGPAEFEVKVVDKFFEAGTAILNEIKQTWSDKYSLVEDNDYQLEISGTDKAGNLFVLEAATNDDGTFDKEKGVYTSKVVVVDTIDPVVNIELEECITDKGRTADIGYYKKATAYVKVIEQNFDSTSTGAKYNDKDAVLEWKLENGVHTAPITLGEDNIYTLNAEATDFALRVGEAEEQTITVDNTAPTVTVEYDNNDVRNGKYFNEKRVATVTIVEKNFASSAEYITIDGIGDATVSTWAKVEGAEDTYRATIDFAAEGIYTPQITVYDKAGNEFVCECEEFVLDWTIENPQIGGVANGKAYKTGVYPSITMQDINFDEDGYTLRLTRTVLGEHDVDVTAQFLGELETDPQGAEGSFGDFERVQENDGIYTLTATMKDLAGNESSSVVTFSVNRFGSVYKYDSTLVSLIKDGGAYVQAVEKDLVITEYNADRLLEDSLNLTITRDGRPVENVKFSATPTINEYAPLGQSGWYQYQYTISKENFAKDGLYKISVSSEDVAGNTPVNNSSEGMDIVFRVDATAAELTSIVGLEESIVNAAELNVRYNVFDAMGIRSIKVYVNGELVGSEINEFGGDKNNYSGSFTIAESNSKQSVRIVVEDLAGNITDTDASSFSSAYAFNNSVTVSTNIFVRLYANKPLFIGTCVGTAAVVAAVVGLISKRRKPEEETV